MKANRYYTKMDSLDFGGYEIPSNKCSRIGIKHTIDARHILLAITYLMKYENNEYVVPEKITKTEIEKTIKNILWDYGNNAFEAPIGYSEDGGVFSSYKEKLPKAIEVIKKLYPEYVGNWVPKSIKYMKKVSK